MSNSTTLLDQIASNQAAKEVVVNALFDAASPATLWGRHASACSGLTFGYYGGQFAGNAIANGTVTLTASATNFVFADNVTGAVSINTTGTPSGKIPLYTIVAGPTTVTSYTDTRTYAPFAIVPGAGSAQPYDMLMFFPGLPVGAAVLSRLIIPRAVTLPASLTGSFASATIAATAATTLTIAKNGTPIGSVNFAAGATAGTFTFSGSVTTSPGDVLTLTNQSPADTTLANISVSIVGTR